MRLLSVSPLNAGAKKADENTRHRLCDKLELNTYLIWSRILAEPNIPVYAKHLEP